MPKTAKSLNWRKYKYINSVVSQHSDEKLIQQNVVYNKVCKQQSMTLSTAHETPTHSNNTTLSAFNAFSLDSDDEDIAYDSDNSIESDLSDCLSSSDDEWNNEEPDLKSKLASWAIEEQINHQSLKKLLGILREHPCHSNLPTDARTLCNTPRTVNLLSLAGGNYYHFGVGKGIQGLLETTEKIPATVELLLNVDGLPITKSTASQLWPILCSLSYTLSKASVFPVGIFHGNKKPAMMLHHI